MRGIKMIWQRVARYGHIISRKRLAGAAEWLNKTGPISNGTDSATK
jgi:hypothetical protein